MTVSSRGIALFVGILALGLSGAATAQENLDANKTPAQLFASDCVMCHKTTRGLTRGKAALGLESFLREHYTASRESAAALAGYLRQTDRGPLPDEPKHKARSTRSEHSKSTEKKSAEKKPAEKEKSANKKADQAKATDKKKTGEKKAGDNKSTEKKAADQKVDKKNVVAKPASKKPASNKPASKKKPKEAQSTSTKPKDTKAAE